jgi:hypothetical protein
MTDPSKRLTSSEPTTSKYGDKVLRKVPSKQLFDSADFSVEGKRNNALIFKYFQPISYKIVY